MALIGSSLCDADAVPWPDNVRELRHLVHRLLMHGGPEEIRLDEIERELEVQAPPDEPLVKQDLLALPLREARERRGTARARAEGRRVARPPGRLAAQAPYLLRVITAP